MTKSKAKYIQSLSQKKQRDQDGVFIAEGPKLLAELTSGYSSGLLEIFALEEWARENSRFVSSDTALTIVSDSELLRLSFLSTPNQVIAVCRKPERPAITLAGSFTLMLDTIQDPGNLGTIIRSADWFNVSQIVCSPDTADACSPKAVQSSMGSIVRVHVEYADLTTKLSAEPGVDVFAATLDGSDVRQNIEPVKGVLLIGNESKGLRPELIALAKKQFTIPRIGMAESLNAAVAAGILLSHLR